MKIAIVSPDDLSTLIFAKSISHLLAVDKNVELITISPIDLYLSEIKKLPSRHIVVSMDRHINPFLDIKYFKDIYSIMKREKFDYVITFTTKPNIYAAPAAKLAKVPVVAMAIRGMGSVFNSKSTFKEKFLLILVTQMYSFACSVSNYVWFTNKYDLKYFVDNSISHFSKAILTKNAIDLKDFSWKNIDNNELDILRDNLSIVSGDFVVILVGRLIKSKGIKEYAEVAVKLYKNYPHIKFLLVAPEEKNSPESIDKEYILDIESRSNLQWLGFRKDIRNLYALSDLSVLQSYYQEGGYPRALLEPMAYGKPVIAGDTDLCRGPVEEGKNGYIIPVKDSDALAGAILKIECSKDIQKKFGKYSKKKVELEFDDQIVIKEMLTKIGLQDISSIKSND
jgi:N,N'-diacetylbacillosaminyl-diphospho-undecaprenol alpha-1,3-N-acetylgalactosaminyltransferase